jgi:hypothetical protein
MAAVAVFAVIAGGCEQDPPGSQTVPTEQAFEPAPRNPPADAIPIGSLEDLQNIDGSGVYVLTGDIDVTGGEPPIGNYKFNGSVTAAVWAPLGGTTFSGDFYGMNHKITVTGGNSGIFDSLKGATIYNLKVKITATASGGQIGGIANSAENSLIDGCSAEVDLTLNDGLHNASAGGIVGFMRNNVTVRNCTASGAITLTSGSAKQMIYAGGIAGYSGPGWQGKPSVKPTRITLSRWNGTVSAFGGYPYAGGVVGYNYTGGKVTQCSSAGTVTATGGNLPYAGGVAGYNSGGDIQNPTADTEAVIENCYSTAEVNAKSTSKAALAGGVAGANACRARISKCYATGVVTAQVAGNSDADIEGLGVMIAASAGGIAGAQYYKGPIVIEYCAALSPSITGTDSATGAVWNIYRIAGAGNTGSDSGVFTGNIAYSGMSVPKHATVWYKTATGKDGWGTVEKPAQTMYDDDMGWDFVKVWKMDTGGYPGLR